MIKFTQDGAVLGAHKVYELIAAVLGVETGRSVSAVAHEVGQFLAGGGVEQIGGLDGIAGISGINVDLEPVRGHELVSKRPAQAGGSSSGAVGLIDDVPGLVLYLHDGILIEVIVFLVRFGVPGRVDAEGQIVSDCDTAVGVFGDRKVVSGGKVHDPDVTRFVVVHRRKGKDVRDPQNEHPAGKREVIVAVKGEDLTAGLVVEGTAPPGGGGSIRPLDEIIVRFAGLGVGHEIGRLGSRRLPQNGIAAEDGVPAHGIVIVKDAQPVVLNGRSVVVFGRFLFGVGSRCGRLRKDGAGREQPCGQRKAQCGTSGTEKFLFHDGSLTGKVWRKIPI